MARATTRTLLSLDRWAELVGINPLHFNQVVVPDIIPNSVCSEPVKQFSWQERDAIGREEIAQAIADAERIMADYLGYTLLPTWQVDERHHTFQPALVELLNRTGLDVQGFRQSVHARWKHFVTGGIEAKELIEAGVAITYSDEDDDGYDETATITVNTAVTDPCELAVYYPVTSGALWLPGGAASDAWEIRPLRSVTIVAGVATIVFNRHQAVIPVLTEELAPTAVDGIDNDNFLPEVDVYRHYNDPSQQVQLMWSPLGVQCGCGDGSCEVCAHATQYGCLLARDWRSSIITYRPGAWDAETKQFGSAALAECRNPDNLRLWYYAGFEDKRKACPTLQMDGSLERAVAYFAIALLDRQLCGCNNLEAMMTHWREELTLSRSSADSSTSYQLGQRVMDNPFGFTRGALFAWDTVNRDNRKVGKAVRL